MNKAWKNSLERSIAPFWISKEPVQGVTQMVKLLNQRLTSHQFWHAADPNPLAFPTGSSTPTTRWRTLSHSLRWSTSKPSRMIANSLPHRCHQEWMFPKQKPLNSSITTTQPQIWPKQWVSLIFILPDALACLKSTSSPVFSLRGRIRWRPPTSTYLIHRNSTITSFLKAK